jgi:hypothetical protein
MTRQTWWDTAFALFGRAIVGGLLGGTLMICYAMINAVAGHDDVWVPLRAIGATFLGDDGVDEPGLKVQGVVLGALIHATNATIFALILAGLLAGLLGALPLSSRLLAVLSLAGGIVYALTIMVVMQNVVVPIADPSFAEYDGSQAQLTLEHVIYGLAVGTVLATAWYARRQSIAPPGVRRLQEA